MLMAFLTAQLTFSVIIKCFLLSGQIFYFLRNIKNSETAILQTSRHWKQLWLKLSWQFLIYLLRIGA